MTDLDNSCASDDSSSAEFDLDFPRAANAPSLFATLRQTPEDFVVDEVVDWEPSGDGEHLLFHIKKRGANTGWVAEQLAKLADVRVMDIGFCGLKDRHAVTTQWFSIYLPKRDVDWQNWVIEGVEILQVARHKQKLRRGMHRANRFQINLTELEGDTSDLTERLQQIQAQGVPNYFGEQRFGRQGNNLVQAQTMFTSGDTQKVLRRKTKKTGMYLSAARSWLFNQVLAERVRAGNWLSNMPGELRVDHCQKNQSPTGPLWGRGRSLVSDDVEQLEQQILSDWQVWCYGLEHAGLEQERRALRLMPVDFQWQLSSDESTLSLSFQLPIGTFATAVIREITRLR